MWSTSVLLLPQHRVRSMQHGSRARMRGRTTDTQSLGRGEARQAEGDVFRPGLSLLAIRISVRTPLRQWSLSFEVERDHQGRHRASAEAVAPPEVNRGQQVNSLTGPP